MPNHNPGENGKEQEKRISEPTGQSRIFALGGSMFNAKSTRSAGESYSPQFGTWLCPLQLVPTTKKPANLWIWRGWWGLRGWWGWWGWGWGWGWWGWWGWWWWWWFLHITTYIYITITYYYILLCYIYIHILTFLSLALLRWWLWLLFWKDLIWTPKTPKTYMDWLSIHSAFHKAEGPGFQPQKPDVSTSSPLFPGWPSEKYESQLGWWNSQYDGKNEKCFKPPTSLPISFHGLSP